jgi:hypothetical protein
MIRALLKSNPGAVHPKDCHGRYEAPLPSCCSLAQQALQRTSFKANYRFQPERRKNTMGQRCPASSFITYPGLRMPR